jgi:hypothetical protein
MYPSDARAGKFATVANGRELESASAIRVPSECQ